MNREFRSRSNMFNTVIVVEKRAGGIQKSEQLAQLRESRFSQGR